MPAAAAPRLLSPRLLSVDALRGLTVAAMVLVNNPGTWSAVYPPLDHAEWHGWTPTDMVFPFFLFIVGVSIPLALGPRLEQGVEGLVRRVLRRSVVIFVLGLLLHALPFFNLATLRIPGVLQRIAVCYLLAALLFVFTRGSRGWRVQTLVAGVLLAGYWLVMTRVPVPGYGAGILTPEGNLAGYVDRLLLGPHIWQASRFYDPEGILSTLPALATTLLGVLAGHWLRGGRSAGRVAGGLVAGGLVAAALAAGHWLTEVRGWRGWARPFAVLGVNALALFFLSSLMAKLLLVIRVGPEDRRLHAWLFDHVFAPWGSPVNASLAYAVAYVLLWWSLMWVLHRSGLRLRV